MTPEQVLNGNSEEELRELYTGQLKDENKNEENNNSPIEKIISQN